MSESPSPKPTFRELLRALRSRRLLVLLFLGFSSGLPYMLMLSSLKIWLRREGIDLGTIGYFSWVAMIYNFNFLWAPLLDRFVPTRLGRRRSWMLFAQLGLIASIAALGISDPQVSIGFIAAVATLVSLFSATQDVAIDAYRRESLPDEEQGIAASLVVYGYRVAILVATGFGLWVVDPETWGLSFQQMFVMIAGLMLVGVVTTLACREPEMEHPLPQTFAETVIDPFVDFMKRDKAVLLLLFVLFFKLGDSFAGSMTGAYYVDLGYSNSQIAEAAKLVGSFSTLIGLFLGGLLIYRLGIFTAMLILAVLQGLSTGSFILLGLIEPRWGALAAIVGFEDLSSGMGTAALVAFMTLLANKRYTATQYALLSSLATSGRTFFAGFSGVLTQHLGYEGLYLIGAALALPGIVFLLILRPAYADSMQALQGSGEDAESQGAGGG